MNCSPKCRTKKLGMIYTILGRFCSFFLNWEGADIRLQIRPRKIPGGWDHLSIYPIQSLIRSSSNKVYIFPSLPRLKKIMKIERNVCCS